jgi:hypothetical protein
MAISDFLFEFTEWLRGTPLIEFALWLSNTSASLFLAQNFFAIPIMQTLHILSIAAAFGSVLMINLRILGLTGVSRTMRETMGRYLPWIWWALAMLILSGIGMIVGEPVRELINPIFWIKMVLVIGVILASLWFQSAVHKRLPQWDMNPVDSTAVRVGAVGIILLWCAVMFAGRWIAYAPV